MTIAPLAELVALCLVATAGVDLVTVKRTAGVSSPFLTS